MLPKIKVGGKLIDSNEYLKNLPKEKALKIYIRSKILPEVASHLFDYLRTQIEIKELCAIDPYDWWCIDIYLTKKIRMAGFINYEHGKYEHLGILVSRGFLTPVQACALDSDQIYLITNDIILDLILNKQISILQLLLLNSQAPKIVQTAINNNEPPLPALRQKLNLYEKKISLLREDLSLIKQNLCKGNLITDSLGIALINVLTSVKFASHIEINFSDTKMTEIGVFQLAKNLKNFKDNGALHFKLDFSKVLLVTSKIFLDITEKSQGMIFIDYLEKYTILECSSMQKLELSEILPEQFLKEIPFDQPAYCFEPIILLLYRDKVISFEEWINLKYVSYARLYHEKIRELLSEKKLSLATINRLSPLDFNLFLRKLKSQQGETLIETGFCTEESLADIDFDVWEVIIHNDTIFDLFHNKLLLSSEIAQLKSSSQINMFSKLPRKLFELLRQEKITFQKILNYTLSILDFTNSEKAKILKQKNILNDEIIFSLTDYQSAVLSREFIYNLLKENKISFLQALMSSDDKFAEQGEREREQEENEILNFRYATISKQILKNEPRDLERAKPKPIGDSGVHYIAQHLMSKANLEFLIEAKRTDGIACKETIYVLNLDNQEITDTGLIALADALKVAPINYLLLIYLRKNNFSQLGYFKLLKTIQSNNKIIRIIQEITNDFEFIFDYFCHINNLLALNPLEEFSIKKFSYIDEIYEQKLTLTKVPSLLQITSTYLVQFGHSELVSEYVLPICINSICELKNQIELEKAKVFKDAYFFKAAKILKSTSTLNEPVSSLRASP